MVDYVVSKMDVGKARKGVVVFARGGVKLLTNAQMFDDLHQKSLSKAIRDSRFQAESASVFNMPFGGRDKVDHVVVVGLGKNGAKTLNDWRTAGVYAANSLHDCGVEEAFVLFEEHKHTDKGTEADAAVAGAFVEGLEMGLYRFNRFKTEQKEHQKPKLKRVHLLVAGGSTKDAELAVAQAVAQAAGVNLARDLVNLPPNYANPDLMVQTAAELSRLGIGVEVLGEQEMKALGFGMLLAVGQGAAQESRLIVLKYTGNPDVQEHKAIVGKGVMFDTGGYDIKSASGMLHMKCDMAGAAAVMGAVKALAERKSKVNVIGVCGCVMNMVSSKAFLPSDVLTSYKGLTVEIGNTDAEGRLVLGDALAYTIDKYKPSEIVDLATLTGACMVALGSAYAGLFSNNEKLASVLEKAGAATGEKLWRLPVGAEYSACLRSQVADVNNVSSVPYGGASTAAAFLHKFVEDTPWAHLDIAGVAMNEKIPGSLPLKGATGFGVRLLVHYLESTK